MLREPLKVVAGNPRDLLKILAKQNTSAQLPFHTRLDPLKLLGDPLKVIAGNPRDILKILANGSPDYNQQTKQTKRFFFNSDDTVASSTDLIQML